MRSKIIKKSFLILSIFLLLFTNCNKRNTTNIQFNESTSLSLNDVNDFVYQLQNIDLNEISNTRFDLVIIDYSRDGSEENKFSYDEIMELKNSPGGSKIVLAYMSIGEAENYRWYWNDVWDADNDGIPDPAAPSWLGPVNPEWPGNYKVKYWDPEWKYIIYAYLDKIIEAGFDGVYLDIIDAYQYWGPGGESGLNRLTAEQEMVDFVKEIANYARVTKGKNNFLVIPQNAEELSTHPDYVQTVSGIGKEDLWYNGNTPQPNEYISEAITNLDVFKNAGKIVLVIDYVTQQDLIDDFYSKARLKGYVPYATVRELDRITINPGHEPD
ncbi:MAG: MJ1477/TM1410 family putative glycoside hydrolase [bacterium]